MSKIFIRSIGCLLASLIIFQCSQFLSVSAEDDRKPSMFKIGDEWLSLPEVHSVLDFGADSTFAPEDDIEGQLRLRASRYWGRLYIDGWPQTIQFFRAHFGIEPPMGRKTFVFAEPRDACSELTNANKFTSDHVILANRGTCTFGAKAKIVANTNASAIVIINNEPGLEHLPGPDAFDVNFSVTSIPQQEGQLLEAYYDEVVVNSDAESPFQGYIVPVNCDHTSPSCMPATYEERRQIQVMHDGGLLKIYRPDASNSKDLPDETLEYLLGFFGVKMWNGKAFSMVIAKPAEACTPIENDVKGKLVLVRRGGCPFVRKAEEVEAAGGRVMIIGSTNVFPVRMGVEPRWKGLNTAIPIAMVSKRTYSILVAETYMGSTLSMIENASVNGSTWQVLENLFNGEGWPRSEAYSTKKYEELKLEHAAWPDRLATIEEAYAKKIKTFVAWKSNGTATTNESADTKEEL